MRQCIIYDSDAPDARLIGIEYIISRRLYEELPEDEKKYWHSHVYEVGTAAHSQLLAMCLIIKACTSGVSLYTSVCQLSSAVLNRRHGSASILPIGCLDVSCASTQC